LKYINRRAKA